MHNNKRAIVASVLARVAAEYDLNEVRKASNEQCKDLRRLDDEYNTLVAKCIDRRITYQIMELLDKTI